jgi:hypothetical protein
MQKAAHKRGLCRNIIFFTPRVFFTFGEKMVPGDRIELPTLRFSVACSTN